METLQVEKIEQEIITIIKELCEKLNIDEAIDGNFCPGEFIRSQVLVSIVPYIESKTGITIPLDIYIFNDKDNNPLSIKSAVDKLLKETKKVKKKNA